MTDEETLMDAVRELRLALKLNQVMFALKIGASPSSVYRWEAGKLPQPIWLAKLAETAHEIRRFDLRSVFNVALADSIATEESDPSPKLIPPPPPDAPKSAELSSTPVTSAPNPSYTPHEAEAIGRLIPWPLTPDEEEAVRRLMRILRSPNPLGRYAIQSNLVAFDEAYGTKPAAISPEYKTPADRLREVEQLHQKTQALARDPLQLDAHGKGVGSRKRRHSK